MNEIISWFKSLPVPIQILSLLVTWSITMIWVLFVIANIGWPTWVNIASIISIIMIWAAGMLGTGMYYDHKERR